MKSIIERIYKVVEYKKDSIYKLSKEIGVSNGYFSKQRQCNGAVSSNIIEKIVEYYPDLDANWLLTGEGQMLKSDVPIYNNAEVDSNHKIGHKTDGKNSPITGNIDISYYKSELDIAKVKIEYLERIIMDKDKTIEILRERNE